MSEKQGKLETLKYGYWIVSLALGVFISVELLQQRREMLELHQTRIAYEAATQNVTNRLIGRLEGAGETRIAEVLAAWQDEVKLEKAKIKKAGVQF